MTYLDHAATTPMLPRGPCGRWRPRPRTVGNASSLHAAGRRARRRGRGVARAGRGRAGRAALRGGLHRRRHREPTTWPSRASTGRAAPRDPRRVRVLASAVEHHAVLDAVAWLRPSTRAPRSTWLRGRRPRPVDAGQRCAAALDDPESVALVTVMWANNEVGTVQPDRRGRRARATTSAGPVAHRRRAGRRRAAGRLRRQRRRPRSAVTGHKLGGPVGRRRAAARPRRSRCTPFLHGGGQERDVRSGHPRRARGRSAAAAAVERASGSRAADTRPGRRPARPRWSTASAPSSPTPSSTATRRAHRLPGIAHFSFPGCEGDALLMLLDAQGIDCSTGSRLHRRCGRSRRTCCSPWAPTHEPRPRLAALLARPHRPPPPTSTPLVAAHRPAVERARRAGIVTVPA